MGFNNLQQENKTTFLWIPSLEISAHYYVLFTRRWRLDVASSRWWRHRSIVHDATYVTKVRRRHRPNVLTSFHSLFLCTSAQKLYKRCHIHCKTRFLFVWENSETWEFISLIFKEKRKYVRILTKVYLWTQTFVYLSFNFVWTCDHM